jgi:hypothetical protein
MSDPSTPDYVRIHVTFDDPEEAGIGGETMWAERVGDHAPGVGLYKINNIAYFCNLRLDDVVACSETDPDLIPEFIDVIEPSDRRGVMLLFNPEIPHDQIVGYVNTWREAFSVSTERAVKTAWAAALPADPDMQTNALAALELLHREKILDYEVEDREAHS